LANEAPYIGGSSTSAWCLFKKLKERDVDVHIMIPSEPQIGFRPSGDGVHIIDVPLIDPNVNVIKGRKAQKTVYWR